MARHKIPLKDKAIVKARIARGLSFDKAKEGTAVRSKQTVGRIIKAESDDIIQLRKEYLAMIRGFGGDGEKRAKVLAKGLKATKLFGKDGVEHPDYKERRESVAYIDKLAGLAQEGGTTINILNNPSFLQQYDERIKD